MEQRYIAGDWVRYIGVASPSVVQIIEVREEKLLIVTGTLQTTVKWSLSL